MTDQFNPEKLRKNYKIAVNIWISEGRKNKYIIAPPPHNRIFWKCIILLVREQTKNDDEHYGIKGFIKRCYKTGRCCPGGPENVLSDEI